MTPAIPAGRKALIPHLVCSPCRDAIEFYKKAFGAQSLGCLMAPDGERVMHAEISIDGQIVFLADDFPEYCGGAAQNPLALGGTPVSIHRYVDDVDSVFQRAIDAGATAKMPVADMFWGDRYGMLVDPFGHSWSVATHIRDVPPEEMQEAMCQAFAEGSQTSAE